MIPSWLQAIVLGVVQGVTEFVPVSSSGHLVLVPYLFGWERPGLPFDVALHVGTLGAIVAYFRAELVAMARGFLAAVLRGNASEDARVYRRVGLLLALATLPVAVVGLAYKDVFEELFENPVAVSGFLLVTATLLVTGERARTRRTRRTGQPRAEAEQRRVWTGDWAGEAADRPQPPSLPTGADDADPAGLTLDRVRVRQALLAGLFQVLALCPGISRSGSTITGGILGGLSREAATRFSFMLALPALAGAAVVSLPDLLEPGVTEIYAAWEIGLGVLAAFVASYLAIRYLVALVARDRLTGFAVYCVVASGVGFLGTVMIG